MIEKEYIEREAAISAIVDNIGDINIRTAIAAGCIIGRIPAVDVRPVVRGKWKNAIQSCNDSPHVKCSVCGEYYWQYFNKFNFCPNCGVDMREEN